MHKKEYISTASLAAIMAFRMLGLFMILPVFSVEAQKLNGATAGLVGIALGIYGLTQAALQMPFGALSDQIGRKPIIFIGLCLFVLGSIICGLAHSIQLMIIGRALQGAGAIGSTILAMVADLIRDEHRSKAMAVIGFTIGSAFTLALILGPIINTWFHLTGIFWFTAILGIAGILLLFIAVPKAPRIVFHQDIETQPNKFKTILRHSQLLRLDFGIFALHTILTAMFVAIPIVLTHLIQLSEQKQVFLYLGVLIIAFVVAVPFIIIAEKRRQMKTVFLTAIMILIFTELLLLTLHQHTTALVIALLLFFCAFTLLEASLPSIVSKISPIRNKGTAMGIYSTSQYFGIFIGGSMGGWIFEHYQVNGVFLFCASVGLAWFLIAASMREPPYLSTLIFNLVDKDPDELNVRLSGISGVAEIAIMPDEKLVYVKADKKIISKDELRNLIEGATLKKQN